MRETPTPTPEPSPVKKPHEHKHKEKGIKRPPGPAGTLQSPAKKQKTEVPVPVYV